MADVDINMGVEVVRMDLEMSVRLFLERQGVTRLQPRVWARVLEVASPDWKPVQYVKAYARGLLDRLEKVLGPDPTPAPERERVAETPLPVPEKVAGVRLPNGVPNRDDI